MLETEEKKIYLFMDKEENALRISEFISKSLGDCLEEGELQELEKWLTEDERHRELFALWSSTELMERKAEVYERLDYMRAWEKFRKVRQDKLSARRRRIKITWMKYAAMFIVPLGIAVALLSKEDIKEEKTEEPITVKAGKSQAVLVLSSGERQVLDWGERSIEDGGMKISADSGRISYDGKSLSGAGVQDAFHMLEVPRGGEYFMTLEDGTKVWLNAATRLKYPVVFASGIRKVILEGEAYFEVKKDANRPFYVHTEAGKVRVLGTAFNVCAYSNDRFWQTTLVEGSVMINQEEKEVLLKPNEQYQIDVRTGKAGLREVLPELYTSWRDGKFYFKAYTFEELVEKLERWYDFKMFYMNEEIKTRRFSGVVNKYQPLEEMFKFLQMTSDVQFNVKGNVVTASLKNR